DNLLQETGAILERTSVSSLAGMSAQNFMRQISVTVFDIDEVEAQLPRHDCGSVEVFDDAADLSIGQHWIFRGKALTPVQNWMVISDPRLCAVGQIGTTKAPRMGQLQSNHQPIR